MLVTAAPRDSRENCDARALTAASQCRRRGRRRMLRPAAPNAFGARAGSSEEKPSNMIQLLCWEGYESPRVLEPFERRGSTRVHARTLLSDAGTAEDLLTGRVPCDVLNINNAYVRGSLHPAGLVRTLDPERFEPHFERMLSPVQPPLRLGARLRRDAHRHLPALRALQPRGQHESNRSRERRGPGLQSRQRARATPLRRPAVRRLQPLSPSALERVSTRSHR